MSVNNVCLKEAQVTFKNQSYLDEDKAEEIVTLNELALLLDIREAIFKAFDNHFAPLGMDLTAADFQAELGKYLIEKEKQYTREYKTKPSAIEVFLNAINDIINGNPKAPKASNNKIVAMKEMAKSFEYVVKYKLTDPDLHQQLVLAENKAFNEIRKNNGADSLYNQRIRDGLKILIKSKYNHLCRNNKKCSNYYGQRQNIRLSIIKQCKALSAGEKERAVHISRIVGERPENLFDFSARIGGGIGVTPGVEQNPALLSGQRRGGIAKSGLSGSLNFSKLSLQLDYLSFATFDYVPMASSGKDDVLSDGDDIRLALIRQNPENAFNFMLQVGYINRRYDYPNIHNYDLHGLIVNWRSVLSFAKGWSFNFDTNLNAGLINTVTLGQPNSFKLGSVSAAAGFSYNWASFIPYFGGIAGYNEQREEGIRGGYIGAAIPVENHEGNIRFDWTNTTGFSVLARYFYNNKESWGIGPQFFFNKGTSNRVQFNQDNIGGGIFARIKLAEVTKLKLPIEIEPFFNVIHQFNPDAATNFNCGINIRAGSLKTTQPSKLRPFSLEPLPEEE